MNIIYGTDYKASSLVFTSCAPGKKNDWDILRVRICF